MPYRFLANLSNNSILNWHFSSLFTFVVVMKSHFLVCVHITRQAKNIENLSKKGNKNNVKKTFRGEVKSNKLFWCSFHSKSPKTQVIPVKLLSFHRSTGGCVLFFFWIERLNLQKKCHKNVLIDSVWSAHQ